MWKLAVLTGFAILGSACATPSYTTRHGLRVFDRTDQGITQADVEHVTNEVIAEIGTAGLTGVDV